MKVFGKNDEKIITNIEKVTKMASRFAIVYVIAFVFGSLISFSSSYRTLCAIAPAFIAVFDLLDKRRIVKSHTLSDHEMKSPEGNVSPVSTSEIEIISQRIQKIESEILEIRKFNEAFNKFRPSIESGLSTIRSLSTKGGSKGSNTLQIELAALKNKVKHNSDCLAQHARFLNDINEIQYKISGLPMLKENVENINRYIAAIPDMISAIEESLEAERKNSNDITALTKMVNNISTAITEKDSVPLNSSQVSLAMETVDALEGHAFERFCANLLEKSGYEDVSVTKGSGDQGVDVLATKDGVRYAVQCKCYSSELGNKPIQEVHAGKDVYGCQIGIVMTNNYFTPGAKTLASATGVLLWDRNILQKMIAEVV